MSSAQQNTTIDLRDYQRAAIDGVYTWFDGSTGNPLVVVPTGGGKSVIAAEMIREICEAMPDERIMVVTHVKELIAQNHKALLRSWPEAPAGIYSAGLKRRDTRSRILFCGVQSVYTKAAQLGAFDLVIVDEAHLIPPRGFGMYQQLLSGLREQREAVKMIGLTATPYRTDTGKLDDGDGRLFHGVAYECSIPEMIDDGWLSPIVNKATRAEIDTDGMRVRGGEFRKEDLDTAARADGLVAKSVEEMVARGRDRKAWLVFASSVQHAHDICDELTLHGVEWASVYGNTAGEVRDRKIADFRAGKIRCMVNVNVLTTGFDAPHVDLIALMRPTKSPGLYVQMVGRGLRICEGKKDCLVLDFGTNVLRHGPIDMVRPTQPKGGDDGEAPMKHCPECFELVFTAVTVCGECGYEWPAREPDHDERPDEDSHIIAGQRHDRYQTWHVEDAFYERHTKPGKPDSVRATYRCGVRRFVSEWVCFEHGGYARRKAEQWWKSRYGIMPAPDTVSDALARAQLGELGTPVTVKVDTCGEYPQVVYVATNPPYGVDDEEREIPTPSDVDDFANIPF